MPCTNPRCVRIREALEALRWREIEWALGHLQDAWEIADRAFLDNLAEQIGDALRHLDSVRNLRDVLRLDRAEEIGERCRASLTSDLRHQASGAPS